MPFVENISWDAVTNGFHRDPSNAVLIQITDKDQSYPWPNHKFNYVFRFDFYDVETEDGITHQQAKELADIIRFVKSIGKDIIVHCHAGLCRSGAVAEVAVMYGFEDSSRPRLPNSRVKRLLMKELLPEACYE